MSSDSTSASPADSTPDPALADALEALECAEVLSWLAESCATEGGRSTLRALLQETATAPGSARRLRGMEALSAQRAEHTPSLARCADVAGLAASARHRVLDGLELIGVAETIERIAELRRWATSHPQYPQLGEVILAAPFLDPLREQIRTAIDARGKVRDEADPALPEVRGLIRTLEKKRNARLEEIAEGLFQRGMLRQRQPVQRGDRLLLAVRATQVHRQSGVIHDRSQSGDTLFLEPNAVLEISNRIAEAQFRERRILDQVLRDLCVEVLRAEPQLQEVQHSLSQVDVALACAAWARKAEADFAMEVEAERGIRLFDARHPLLVRQMGSEGVVPLNLQLGSSFDLLVVTGPNTGGKTLVLKTVGLLAWMANRGLPIPAANGSEVPGFRAVLADIGDAQSLESSLSTFSGHLQRTQRILAQAGPGILVLLDELGTGTDPEEGAALGQAVLETLQDQGAWILASTHLGSLKLFSLDRPRAENASMEFDPLTLSPQYRLLVGVPGASHAVEVAERLGLELDLLERARQLVSRGDGAEQLLADVGRVRREAEILRESAGEEELRVLERSRSLASEEASSKQRQVLRESEAEQHFQDHARALTTLLERIRDT
ncbi:MAG: endonuclease MutS2, partial [Planctomycetota bacterium]